MLFSTVAHRNYFRHWRGLRRIADSHTKKKVTHETAFSTTMIRGFIICHPVWIWTHSCQRTVHSIRKATVQFFGGLNLAPGQVPTIDYMTDLRRPNIWTRVLRSRTPSQLRHEHLETRGVGGRCSKYHRVEQSNVLRAQRKFALILVIVLE